MKIAEKQQTKIKDSIREHIKEYFSDFVIPLTEEDKVEKETLALLPFSVQYKHVELVNECVFLTEYSRFVHDLKYNFSARSMAYADNRKFHQGCKLASELVMLAIASMSNIHGERYAHVIPAASSHKRSFDIMREVARLVSEKLQCSVDLDAFRKTGPELKEVRHCDREMVLMDCLDLTQVAKRSLASLSGRVLILDDIFDTGSTLSHMADRIKKANKSLKVDAVALSKVIRENHSQQQNFRDCKRSDSVIL